jgi:hypothetical protein
MSLSMNLILKNFDLKALRGFFYTTLLYQNKIQLSEVLHFLDAY